MMGDTFGFIGLGSMGGVLADRILQAGYELSVYDISDAAKARFVGRARIADSVLEVTAYASVVFACLPTVQSTLDVALGDGGIISGEAVKLYAHLGTTGAEVVEQISASLATRSIATVDVPVTGGRARAVAGELSVIASGSTVYLERITPIMGAYANKIFPISEVVGDAQKMKVVNNILSAANLASAAEALVVGTALGLQPAMIIDVLNSGSGQNSATLSKLPRHVLTGSFDVGSTMDIVEKDLNAYVRAAARCGVDIPLGMKVVEAFNIAKSEEGEKADMTAVIRPMERSAGVECRMLTADTR